MNREQRQSLIDQLWERDEPHVMIVKYDKTEKLGVQASTITYHTNPIQAIDAFFCLLGDRGCHHHPALNDNLYRWLTAHSNPDQPSAKDFVDDVMSDLNEYLTFRHHIVFIEIIPLLEHYTRDHDTLASRLETTTDIPLVPMPEYTYGLCSYQPTPNPASGSLEREMTNVGDVAMFDHWIPPARLPFEVPAEHSFLDDEAQALLLPSQTDLFATPTLSPAALSAANVAPAPLPAVNNIPRVHNSRLNLDARRAFACTVPSCPSRSTRPSDLARHCRNNHPNPPEQ
jgi:hypothetical protein